ncbi:MAG TPA: hypothetical protein VGG76_02930 [Gemmatimonadaceae bacterium]
MRKVFSGGAKALVVGSSLFSAMIACGRAADSNRDTTQTAQSSMTSPSTNPDSPVVVRGVVQSATPNQVVLKVDTGAATIKLSQPFHLYARGPSDLAHVTQNSFIGVTTVKQPDGSERATEIHIFPEDLRGLGEGSRMMAPNNDAAPSRMTNGNVSQSRMTNGNVSQSRMSNGNVSSTNGSSLVVQYKGGSQNVTVPPNTPVTELKPMGRALVAGDSVAMVVKRAADGSLTSDKAISTKR